MYMTAFRNSNRLEIFNVIRNCFCQPKAYMKKNRVHLLIYDQQEFKWWGYIKAVLSLSCIIRLLLQGTVGSKTVGMSKPYLRHMPLIR